MVKRPAFFICRGKVVSDTYSFEWYSGFAVSQKQKSIKSLHNAIIETDANAKPLEVSTKSRETIGIKLSAFNLKINNYTLENIFQSTYRLPRILEVMPMRKVLREDGKYCWILLMSLPP